MPIKDYLKKLKESLTDIEPLGQSSHFPPYIILPVEEELMLGGKYVRRVPDDYPSGFGEELGLRSLRNAVTCSYNNAKLRAGITTLHIKCLGSEKNLKSAVLLNMNNVIFSTVKVDGEKGPKAGEAVDVAYVMLHENGVISALYGTADSIAVGVNSWYPVGMKGFGGLPYPTKREDAVSAMETVVRMGTGRLYSSTSSIIPDLVMLAAETYRDVSKE